MQPRTNRIASILFAVYLVLYSGFVVLNAFAPTAMEATPVAGVNLAILYGFGLIVTAFLLALLYGWLVVRPSRMGRAGIQQEIAAADSGRVRSDRPAGTPGPTSDRV